MKQSDIEFDEEGYQKLPSFLQMAKNFSKDIIKYVSAGSPVVNKEDYEERLEVCNTCPHLIKKKKRCGKCGCYLEHKAKMRTSVCPDTPPRWKWQDPTPQTEAEERSQKVAIEKQEALDAEAKLTSSKIRPSEDGRKTM